MEENELIIYCIYDQADGEILCAFLNEDDAIIESKEGGTKYQKVNLFKTR